MAVFSDLSTEVLLMILEHSLPADLVSLSLVSRYINSLSTYKLNQKFAVIAPHSPIPVGDYNFKRESTELTDLCATILNDRCIGHYVRELDLEDWPFRIQAPRYIQGLQSICTTAHILAFLASIPLDERQRENWLKALQAGDEDSVVALLLALMPNLRRLRVNADNLPPACMMTVASLAASPDHGLLTKLKYVRLSNISYQFLWPGFFMALPSVTSIEWHATNSTEGLDNVISRPALLPIKSSNVVDLKMKGGYMKSETLRELLHACKNLQNLEFDYPYVNHGSPRDDCLACLDCHDLVVLLVSSAKHSLRTLGLRFNEPYTSRKMNRYVSNFGQFKQLKSLKVEAAMLLGSQNQEISYCVATRLPPSLQRLEIHYGREAYLRYQRESLRILEHPEEAHFPELRKLHVCFDVVERAKGVADLLRADEGLFGLNYGVHSFGFSEIFLSDDDSIDPRTQWRNSGYQDRIRFAPHSVLIDL